MVEVLSESTAAYDRGDTFDRYVQNETLQEYVLVDTQARAVEVRTRQADGTWPARVYMEDADVELESLGLTVPLALVYEDVEVGR